MEDDYQDDVDDTQDDTDPEDALIDEIMGDDGYESEDDDDTDDDDDEGTDGDDDAERDSSESDTDDEERDAKGEDDELESILDRYSEQQEDDEEETPGDEITDEDIARAVYVSKDYEGWMDAAYEEGRTIDESFAALVGKGRIPAETLTQNNIFSLNDMAQQLDTLQRNQDPDRLVVPDEDADTDEWRQFLNEGFNVPLERDGYKDDLFADTFLAEEGNEGVRDAMRTLFHENFFSEEQAYAMIDAHDTERKAFLEQQRNDYNDYMSEQEALMRKEYREDFPTVMKEVSSFIKKYGPEFRDENLREKVMSSASLTRMIHRAMNDAAAPGHLQLKSMSMDIKGFSNEGLSRLVDRLHEERKNVAEYKKFHESTKKSERGLYRKYKSNTIKLNEAMNEVNRRGLEYS